jgi:hypothetical protein
MSGKPNLKELLNKAIEKPFFENSSFLKNVKNSIVDTVTLDITRPK